MTEEDFQQQEQRRREAEEKKRRVQAGLPETPPPPPPERSTDEIVKDMTQQFKELMAKYQTVVEQVDTVIGNMNAHIPELITTLNDLRNDFKEFASTFLKTQQQHRDRVKVTLDKLDDSLNY